MKKEECLEENKHKNVILMMGRKTEREREREKKDREREGEKERQQ